MAKPFIFSPSHIDHHTESVGIDIRPVIECKIERVKLFDFGNKIVDKYPNLFESLVQSPTDFNIMKKFIFPGKGEMDTVTLAVTQRGLVFRFPRRIGAIDEEIDLGETDEIVLDCLKIYRRIFPEKKVIRVGKVNEYIFNIGQSGSTGLIAERFTKVRVPPNGEIKLSINRPSDDYNRSIGLLPVKKVERISEMQELGQTKGYGVQVNVDFNNRERIENLDKDKILCILHDARVFNDDELYRFLNCEPEGK